MSNHLKSSDLTNTQQMEVAVNGPDGATHLILCTGVAMLGSSSQDSYTFLVGPQLSRRQFVGAIVSGAFATIQAHENQDKAGNPHLALGVTLLSITAQYDEESAQVMVQTRVSSRSTTAKLAISYHISILAELPSF